MKCLHPVTIKFSKPIEHFKVKNNETEEDTIIKVQCGKCASCLKKRTTEWTLRINQEIETSFESIPYFCTFTYDEPYTDGNLHNEDFQKYIKRLRKKTGKKIKYWASGEYGDIGGRPHFHAIIIGLNQDDKEAIDECWGMGFTDVKGATPGRIKYVINYMKKTIPEELPKELNKPKPLISKKIGFEWWEKNRDQIIFEGVIKTARGTKHSIPRYYLKKENEETLEFLNEKIMKNLEKENPELTPKEIKNLDKTKRIKQYKHIEQENRFLEILDQLKAV